MHSLKMAMSCRNKSGYSDDTQSLFLFCFHLIFFKKTRRFGNCVCFRLQAKQQSWLPKRVYFLNLEHGERPRKAVCVRHTPLSKPCSVRVKTVMSRNVNAFSWYITWKYWWKVHRVNNFYHSYLTGFLTNYAVHIIIIIVMYV